MKKSLMPLALSVLLLAGCSTGTNSPEAPTVEPAAPSTSESAAPATTEASEAPTPEPSEVATSAAPEAAKSTRGNLIKEIGEGAGITDEGEQVVSFVVNSIAVDVPCTGNYPSPVENGHILVLDVSVVTDPALAESISPTFYMNPYDFTEIAPNGTTSNADLGTMATYSCLPDAEVLPQEIGPGENVTGKLVLDVTNPTGTLVFKYAGSPSGWEWTYPNP
ncbi:hypothetical protein E8P82_14795 [Arthrobacter echini]|uniref:DUF4352 domain-containing protein n=1 Tax=Arthrobacter echini TaxID=1529066 RepID=A0A4S5DZR9_9MICC|nr:hypothetical protein [Arthrobacter echini]THJ64500.1 hypothetical protein E8P82_14795 [Arthrobacter echini]